MPLHVPVTRGHARHTSERPQAACSARIRGFLEHTNLPTPFLVVDVAAVLERYLELQRALPDAAIHYAAKANPLPDIIRALASEGSCFDVASRAEIAHCLGLGVPASRLSFGHTVKKAAAIADAHAMGITAFACDSLEELDKIARHAPGADVTVRLLSHGAGAEWPLSRKFGCDSTMACELLVRARARGLTPAGVSFHVGSQQTDPGRWDEPIAVAAEVFRSVGARGIQLHSLNLGGGFPAHYSTVIPPIADYGAAITQSLRRHFGHHQPRIIVEPGRYLVADAGVIETEVVLVARRFHDEDIRWVYLDCGKFGGLAETMDEAIKYRFHVPGRSGRPTRVILAGPTCDSADILYERTPCCLPADLQAGDRVQILSAGAYTHTYSAVGFNGFSPLHAVCITTTSTEEERCFWSSVQ
jgi:ornithine decarboxylase